MSARCQGASRPPTAELPEGSGDVRHLTGVMLAAVIAVALFFLAGWGSARISALSGHGGGLASQSGLLAICAVVGTGLLVGIAIAVPSVSPLAAGLPGLLLLAWSVLLVVSQAHAIDLVPMRERATGAGFEALLRNGTLALAGIAMIIPLFLPSRWLPYGRSGEAGPGWLA
jgi:hypothetical protein